MLKVNCGGCGKTLKVPDKLRGKNPKCPICGETVLAEEDTSEPDWHEEPQTAASNDHFDDLPGLVPNWQRQGNAKRPNQTTNVPDYLRNKPTGPSDKLVLVAVLLLIFLGGFGLHAFYAGRIGQGLSLLLMPVVAFELFFVLPLAAFIVLLLLAVFLVGDFLRLVLGAYKDGDGKTLVRWT